MGDRGYYCARSNWRRVVLYRRIVAEYLRGTFRRCAGVARCNLRRCVRKEKRVKVIIEILRRAPHRTEERGVFYLKK